MNAPDTRRAKKKMSTASFSNQRMKPQALLFWDYVSQQSKMSEAERLTNIRHGLSAELPVNMCAAFDLDLSEAATILQASKSTLEQHARKSVPLSLGASERLDRVAQVAGLALEVLEGPNEAAKWLTRPHPALVNEIPIFLCDTEIGARQIRRILSGIEWGNVA
jgi:putative toxin-antitoxin system antitoxin component (TIGR02293 family)